MSREMKNGTLVFSCLRSMRYENEITVLNVNIFHRTFTFNWIFPQGGFLRRGFIELTLTLTVTALTFDPVTFFFVIL